MSWLSDEASAAFANLKNAIEHPSLSTAISEVKAVSAAIAEYQPLIALVEGLVPAAAPVVTAVETGVATANTLATGLDSVLPDSETA